MHHLSSLPLKKRPLRNDFTSIEDLAAPHSQGLLMTDIEITSSGRSSSASSTDREKETILQQQFSPLNTIYCTNSPFALICNENGFKKANRYISIERSKCFMSPTSSFRTMPYVNNNNNVDEKSLANISFTSSNNASSYNHHHVNSINHSNSSIYCHPCNKHFVGRAKYQAHIRRHNSKLSGRYECTNCGKRFVQRSSLVTHLRIHTGERPYKCVVRTCSESFSDFSTYTKHIRTHTGEKPYTCPICLRAFSQSGNMHRHLKGVHKQITPSDLIEGSNILK